MTKTNEEQKQALTCRTQADQGVTSPACHVFKEGNEVWKGRRTMGIYRNRAEGRREEEEGIRWIRMRINGRYCR